MNKTRTSLHYSDGEKEDFHISPRTPRNEKPTAITGPADINKIIRLARRAARHSAVLASRPSTPKGWQRCAVKIKYSRNFASKPWEWKQFANYVARQEATNMEPSQAGFDKTT